MSNEYNDTLNLPKTEFPMRAGLPEREPEILKEWEQNDIYNRLMEINKDKPLYVLHDGPPYANGDIHLGHALNKILKDFIVRYKNMSGYKAPYIPGWDTHGLPTELKARAKARVGKSTDISDEKLREICREFALGYVDNQRQQFKRLGNIGDWNNPYITLMPEYEAKQIEIFAKMASKGAIYRGLKPVYWCPTCETALAEAEIEYNEDRCNSIYVKFKISDDRNKLKSMEIDLSKTYFIIWTTTAWTLPGNTAICVGPDFKYSIVRANHEFYIIADSLVKDCMDSAGIDDYKVIGNIIGKDLEYIKAEHPFLNRDSVVIVGEHVTVESGTGCVHTAPGHGVEDFEVCQNYKDIPIIVPVDNTGKLTDEAGKFSGMHISDAGDKIIETLKEKNLLFAYKDISHQYPHCWRCKEPIIFRATEQWFCSINAFKDKALKAIDSVKWIPEWGRDRIYSMVNDRKDWCISRQRKWGIPIPIFFCEECGEPLIDEIVILYISKIFKEKGSDIWFKKDADYFLPPGIKCRKCDNGTFRKEKDIMDVWFDSGVSHFVVCDEGKGLKWPADLYLEGSDQYRGWFQSSLLTAVACEDCAPYKCVVTHGWVVDEEGKKQSKSVGNGVKPSGVIEKYGADILRLWVASADYHADIKISHDILKQLSESYRKIRNTARYIISNLYDFNPDTDMCNLQELYPVDRWILISLNNLIDKVKVSYESFEFYNVYHSVKNFCIVDLSNFYLDVLKDRLYADSSSGLSRRAAQTSIYIILDCIVRLISPVLAYTSQEIWRYIPHKKGDNIESILFNDMPKKVELHEGQEFVRYWHEIHELRNDIKKNLETARKNKVIGSSLDAHVVLYCNNEMYDFIKNVSEELRSALIVSKLDVLKEGTGENKSESFSDLTLTVKHAEGDKCERCWTYSDYVGISPEHPSLCRRCSEVVG